MFFIKSECQTAGVIAPFCFDIYVDQHKLIYIILAIAGSGYHIRNLHDIHIIYEHDITFII